MVDDDINTHLQLGGIVTETSGWVTCKLKSRSKTETLRSYRWISRSTYHFTSTTLSFMRVKIIVGRTFLIERPIIVIFILILKCVLGAGQTNAINRSRGTKRNEGEPKRAEIFRVAPTWQLVTTIDNHSSKSCFCSLLIQVHSATAHKQSICFILLHLYYIKQRNRLVSA
jgi:hypothetical protein